MRSLGYMTAVLGGLAVSGTGGAAAQEAAEAPGRLATQIENVTVTARKVEEPEQSTPVAMTVLSSAALDRLFVNDLTDISATAPNVVLEPTGIFRSTVAFFIRGMGTGDVDSAEGPAIGVVVDGVAMARNAQALIDLFDVESIEILRGPQGTLFGRNTVGGVVNVRTRRPTGEFGVRGRLTFGKNGRADIRAAVDFPIVADKVAAKIAVLSQNFDGFFHYPDGKKAGGDDLFVIRPTVRFTPSDSFDLTLFGEVQRDRGDIYPSINGSVPGFVLANIGYSGYDLDEGDNFRINFDAPNINRVNIYGISAEANWHAPFGTLTSITGYREAHEYGWTDLDASPIPFFNTVRPLDHSQFSQELRLASEVTDWLNLVVGLYFMRQEFAMPSERATMFVPGIPYQYQYTSQEHKSYAGFFNANVRLSDSLRVTLGGRYTYEKKWFVHAPMGACTGPGLANCPAPFYRDASWDDFSPKVGVDYTINDNAMVYASWSRGFRSGGFAGRATTATTLGPFNDETVDAYEIGFKSDWFDRRLRLNLAAFWNEYDDLQRSIIRASSDGVGNETITANAAGARIRGIEAEFTAIPLEGLTLQGSVGYLDAKYADFCSDLNGPQVYPSVPTSECGNVTRLANGSYLVDTDNSFLKLQKAPKLQLRASVNYETPLGDLGMLGFNLDYSHSAKMFLTVGNEPFGLREPTDLLNGSVTYTTSDERLRVSFFVKNITNSVYKDAVTIAPPLLRVWVPSQPRHWGVELGFEF